MSDDLLARFIRWAATRDDVRAAVLVGSRARSERPADAYSDVDLVLFVHDPPALLDDSRWPGELGEVGITFVEQTPMPGVRERRVLFADGTDVDFVIAPFDRLRELVEIGSDVLARGHRILVDRDGVAAFLATVAPPTRDGSLDAELSEAISDFWYHAVWTARKLRRGETLMAKECLDCHMKALVIRVAGWHAGDRRALHDARFIEEWADPRVLEALPSAYAGYDAADVKRALDATMDLFSWLAREMASRVGVTYADDEEELARRLAGRVLADGE